MCMGYFSHVGSLLGRGSFGGSKLKTKNGAFVLCVVCVSIGEGLGNIDVQMTCN